MSGVSVGGQRGNKNENTDDEALRGEGPEGSGLF